MSRKINSELENPTTGPKMILILANNMVFQKKNKQHKFLRNEKLPN